MSQRIKTLMLFLSGLLLIAGCGQTPPETSTSQVWSVNQNRYVSKVFGPPEGAIVITMASWCKFCAWEAKWQEPSLIAWAHQHHIKVYLLDISGYGGIGIPGPLSNSGAGLDQVTRLSSSHQMAQLAATMQEYARHFHVSPTIIYLDPKGSTIFAKETKLIPSMFFLNKTGNIVKHLDQVQTASHLEQVATQLGLGKA